jgi:DNA-binding NarL/FixJ family response regulator
VANRTLKVVVADNSSRVLQRLERMTTGVPNIKIVRPESKEVEIPGKTNSNNPDVAIFEVNTPEASSIKLIKEIKKQYPSTIVIVLANNSSNLFKAACYASGVNYLFDKSEKYKYVADVLNGLAKGYLPIYFN